MTTTTTKEKKKKKMMMMEDDDIELFIFRFFVLLFCIKVYDLSKGTPHLSYADIY